MVKNNESCANVRNRTIKQFVKLCNIIEPDHYYFDKDYYYYQDVESLYPISCDDVDYEYTRKLKWAYAKCGPRNGLEYCVGLEINADKWTGFEQSKKLVILIHEMTHLRFFGAKDDTGGTHSREFWNRFSFYCMTALDNWNAVIDLFPKVIVDDFKVKAIHDVNSKVLDERQLTVDEAKSMIREYLDGYRPNTRFTLKR